MIYYPFISILILKWYYFLYLNSFSAIFSNKLKNNLYPFSNQSITNKLFFAVHLPISS